MQFVFEVILELRVSALHLFSERSILLAESRHVAYVSAAKLEAKRSNNAPDVMQQTDPLVRQTAVTQRKR